MRLSLSLLFALIVGLSFGQITAPQLSASIKMEQTVGLTTINVDYSRPGKRDRVVFGELVPFDAVWRTGANENTRFKTDKRLVFGKDTLKAGTYSLYTRPGKTSWDIIFYATTDNWGTPDEWKEENVVMTVKADITMSADVVETFTIDFSKITTKGAMLSFAWDKTRVHVPFKVMTDVEMISSIKKAMAGPSSSDYYAASNYFFVEKKDTKQALIWMDKAIELRKGDGSPFWMYRKKALMQADLKDFKGAIASAEKSIEGAKAANYQNYVDENVKSIEEWKKM